MEEKKLPKILIVDDEEFMRSNIDFILPDEKYQKLFAINGEECLYVAKEHLPHLILLDVGMPGLDGIEICKKLKIDSLTKDIPVIFITGKNLPKEKSKGFAVGGSDYITKPIEEMELKARICNLIKVKQEQDNVKEALKQTSDLLNNMKQAVFAIDESLNLKEPISKFSEKIFNQEILGKNFFSILFPEKDIKSAEYKSIEKTFQKIIGNDNVVFYLFVDDLPKRIDRFEEDGLSKKILEISYEPIFDSNEKVEKVLCSIHDITSFDSYLENIKNDQLNYLFIKDFIAIDKKDSFCESLKDCIHKSVDALNEVVSPSSKVLEVSFYKKAVSKIIRELENSFKGQPVLKERLSQPIIAFANWDNIEDQDGLLLSAEILSAILEVLIRYGQSANFIYPVEYTMDFSFEDLIKEKVESIQQILSNLFLYTPGLDKLDPKELSHITKIIKMYPNLIETLQLVQQRSLLISCLCKAQLKNELSILFRVFASNIGQISLKRNINEKVIKLNLLNPYNKILEALKN